MKKILAAMLTVAMLFTVTPSMGNAKAAKKPGRVTKVKLTNPIITGKKTNALTISWKKTKRAKKYQVFMLKSKWTKYKTVKGRTAWVGKLKHGKKYKFKVRALNGKKKGKFSKVVRVVVHKNGQMTTYDSCGKKQAKPVGEGYKLVQLAKRHIGGVYRVKGTYLKDPKKKGDKNKIDCTGFVQAIFSKYANITLPPGNHKKMIKAALKIGKKVKSMEAAQMGDLVFYRNYGSGRTQHVAICAGNGKIIDASRSLNGVYVHNQSSQKPVCIVRVLRSGGARQVLTQEERRELEISEVDKKLNKYYQSRGMQLPSKEYTFLSLLKNNEDIVSYVGTESNSVYITLTNDAEEAKAKYAKKLKLPQKPGMNIDGNGKVTLTGNVENYYRMLISLGWLTTENCAFQYGISEDCEKIDSITVKNGETFVNVIDKEKENRQIIFRGIIPVRSYFGCKEGDKFIIDEFSNKGDFLQGYECYPMLLDKGKKLHEYDYDDFAEMGAGVGIIEVGKPIPIMYDEYGELYHDFSYKGFRQASLHYAHYDGERPRLSIDKFSDKNQDYYDYGSSIYVRKYDEKEVKNAYNKIKKTNGKFKCVDGTVINNYNEFMKMCRTGMYPYTHDMKNIFENMLESECGYYAVFN